ncbi:hypothetical protein R1flu_004897 [Riccia fluitans]|uniref:Uncharacterized protein n=1 Tax=Riccia fluitans TaxID=41844 RepID=A0ABD1YRX9_9MARC
MASGYTSSSRQLVASTSPTSSARSRTAAKNVTQVTAVSLLSTLVACSRKVDSVKSACPNKEKCLALYTGWKSESANWTGWRHAASGSKWIASALSSKFVVAVGVLNELGVFCR